MLSVPSVVNLRFFRGQIACEPAIPFAVNPTLVINAVGLTPALLGQHTPNLTALVNAGSSAAIGPVLPAVTCSVQATYLTGTLPQEHGIVGNGWYSRENAEVKFWKQSAMLVQRPRLWEEARRIDPAFTVANLFWWHAMYSTADYTVTPRPMYPADGRKLPDIWTHPASLRDTLQRELGQFPLFKFWGPLAGIDSTRWIVDATIAVEKRYHPTLTLTYLPHLDYDLQRHGPNSPQATAAAAALDEQIGRLLGHFRGHRILVLSEYGIEPVNRPVHLNRRLREAGLLAVRDELGREQLDAGASDAFAVADHQVSHVYVRDPAKRRAAADLLAATPGVGKVYVGEERREIGLDHPRAGDLVVLAEHGAWFTYYFWLDDAKAPDYASTVDIHRKPGYDPAELALDPALCLPTVKIVSILLRKKLGQRTLLNVIPIRGEPVRGSHGLVPAASSDGPILISNRPDLPETVKAVDVKSTILASLTNG